MIEKKNIVLKVERENDKNNEPDKDTGKIEASLGKSANEIEGYTEGLKYGKRIFFPYLLIVAVASDLFDPVPVVGFFLKIIALLIIWYNFGIVGRAPGYLEEKHKVEVSWKVRMALRLMGLTDLVPLINVLPLTTVSVLIVWFKNKQDIKKKEKELLEEEEKAKRLKRQWKN